MHRHLLVAALALLGPTPARAEVQLASEFSAGLGALRTTRSTSKFEVADTSLLLAAHASLGMQLNDAGAALVFGEVGFPATDREYGTLLTAGLALRFGADVRFSLGGGVSFWTVAGASRSGPALVVRAFLPLSGPFGVYAGGAGHFFTGATLFGGTVGVAVGE